MTSAKQHVHTGFFALIGVLILIGIGMGFYFMHQEQQWSEAYESLSKQYQEVSEKLVMHELREYDGPYGVLSYVKYNQVQSTPSMFPLSRVTQFQQASCSMTADAEIKTIPSNIFTIQGYVGTTALKDLDEAAIAALQQALYTNLTWANPERLPLYNLSTLCVFDSEHLLLLGFDASNSALRVPIVIEREDGSWNVRKLPPTLTPFVSETLVRLHPDGSPLIVDVYTGVQESAWQAYYIDSQFQIVDLIESCRIVDQGGKYVRICERLYEPAT